MSSGPLPNQRVRTMPSFQTFIRSIFVAVAFVSSASVATAQFPLSGTVNDSGKPVAGAVVTVENPQVVPSKLTATTDEKGRFAILGLRTGAWTYSVTATGYDNAKGAFKFTALKGYFLPITIKKGSLAKQNEGELGKAETLLASKQYDEAIAVYKGVLAKAPSLYMLNLQIAQAYRGKKEFDNALAMYKLVLESDPANETAKVGIGLTNLEKGDFKAAEEILGAVAQSPTAQKEDFYNYAELKFAAGDADAAQQWYQKAIDADPTYARAMYQLGMVALNKGDKQAAAAWLNKVIAAAPTSVEAAQAQAIVGQLK
jgi:tetratricopeptide (TPR) repeat protein